MSKQKKDFLGVNLIKL